MRLHPVQSTDHGGLAAVGDAARDARAAAMARRRQLSQGKRAMTSGGAFHAPEGLQANGAGVPPAAYPGRALSMQRRRQLAQGKKALNGGAGTPTLVVHRGGAG
jgi:hypothetical protein